MRSYIKLFFSALILCLFSPIVNSQQPLYYNNGQDTGQYNEWQDKGNNDTGLIRDLNQLIDKAERERAADWRFLRDLRETINRYDYPWHRKLLFDDFSDGNFTSQPAWQVLSGNFTVDRYGLRTNVISTTGASGSSQKKEDVGALVFGALLEEIARKNGADKKTSNSPQIDALYIPLAITNAFASQLDITALQDSGQLEWGVYVDQQRQEGYRIVWHATKSPALELLAVERSGSRVIRRQQIPDTNLRGRNVQIGWNRNQYGDMQVTVNGQRIISVRDRGIPGDFSGFEIVNQGGEFSIRQVKIDGI